MYSFRDRVSLPAAEIDRIVATVEPFAFDQIYGVWWDPNVGADANDDVRRSAVRYNRAIGS